EVATGGGLVPLPFGYLSQRNDRVEIISRFIRPRLFGKVDAHLIIFFGCLIVSAGLIDLSQEEGGISSAGGLVADLPTVDGGQDVEAAVLSAAVLSRGVEHPCKITVEVRIVRIGFVE